MSSVCKLQDTCHRDLTCFVNYGRRATDCVRLRWLLPLKLTHHAAVKLIEDYEGLHGRLPPPSDSCFRVTVKPYHGENPYVARMQECLSTIETDLHSAFLHGSLGTGEEIDYSDFDAVVILSHDVFRTPEDLLRVARCLYRSQSIMYRFDPLQHHGWFVLTELDLQHYCNAYLPMEVFPHSQSLIGNTDIDFHPRAEPAGSDLAFRHMARSLGSRINSHNYPKDLYQLKSVLSQFMLLPALFLSARDGQGVFKRESFGIAREFFDAEEWEVMDEISRIRDAWVKKTPSTWNWAISYPHPITRRVTKKFAPGIPETIAEHLTEEVYKRMARLISAMEKELSS